MLRLGLTWARAACVCSRPSKSGHPETERSCEQGVSHHPPWPSARSRAAAVLEVHRGGGPEAGTDLGC